MELKYKLTKVSAEYERIADMIGGADTSNFKLKLCIVADTSKVINLMNNIELVVGINNDPIFKNILITNNDIIPINTEIIFLINDNLQKKEFNDNIENWKWTSINPPTMKKTTVSKKINNFNLASFISRCIYIFRKQVDYNIFIKSDKIPSRENPSYNFLFALYNNFAIKKNNQLKQEITVKLLPVLERLRIGLAKNWIVYYDKVNKKIIYKNNITGHTQLHRPIQEPIPQLSPSQIQPPHFPVPPLPEPPDLPEQPEQYITSPNPPPLPEPPASWEDINPKRIEETE